MQLTALLAIAATLGPALAAPIGTASNSTITIQKGNMKVNVQQGIKQVTVQHGAKNITVQLGRLLEPREPKKPKKGKKAPIPAPQEPIRLPGTPNRATPSGTATAILPEITRKPEPLTFEGLMAYRHSKEFSSNQGRVMKRDVSDNGVNAAGCKEILGVPYCYATSAGICGGDNQRPCLVSPNFGPVDHVHAYNFVQQNEYVGYEGLTKAGCKTIEGIVYCFDNGMGTCGGDNQQPCLMEPEAGRVAKAEALKKQAEAKAAAESKAGEFDLMDYKVTDHDYIVDGHHYVDDDGTGNCGGNNQPGCVRGPLSKAEDIADGDFNLGDYMVTDHDYIVDGHHYVDDDGTGNCGGDNQPGCVRAHLEKRKLRLKVGVAFKKGPVGKPASAA